MNLDEYDYWKTQVRSARRTQLDNVRKAATAWSALLAAILGVFGTATLVSGLPGLDEIDHGTADALRRLILVIAGLLLISVVLSGLASTSFPRIVNDLTVETMRNEMKTKAMSSRKMLGWSIGFGGAAAVLLTVGSGVVLLSEKSKSPDTPTKVLVTTGEGTFCGPLAIGSNGLEVERHRLSGVKSVVTVSACPKASD